jgi:phosphoglycolate phosphatase-like HAD superfamily hydrolase
MATILCDLDGTLLMKASLDPPGVVSPKRAALNQALAEVCAAPSVDFRQGMEHGLTDWQISERAVQVQRPQATIDAELWGRIRARAEALFVPQRPLAGQPVYRALPGVPSTLLALRRAGHRLGLVTGNLALFALFKLDEAGIDRSLFEGPAAFSDHGRRRADILRTALALAGSPDPAAAGGFVVLGDTVHDQAGAATVGLPFLGTGTMGLREEDLRKGPDPDLPSAWVPDLGDAGAVLAAVAGLIERRIPGPQ